MSVQLSDSPHSQTATALGNKKKSNKKRGTSTPLVTLFFYTLFALFFFGMLGSVWFFLTESGTNVRLLMADTLITTQHRHWAKYLIGNEELEKRVNRYWTQFDKYSEVKDQRLVHITPEPVVPVVEEVKK